MKWTLARSKKQNRSFPFCNHSVLRGQTGWQGIRGSCKLWALGYVKLFSDVQKVKNFLCSLFPDTFILFKRLLLRKTLIFTNFILILKPLSSQLLMNFKSILMYQLTQNELQLWAMPSLIFVNPNFKIKCKLLSELK